MCDLIPLVIIGILNIYLVSMLFVAAVISDAKNPVEHAEKLNIYPHRVASLFLLIFFLATFTFSFAALYNHATWVKYPFSSVNSFDCIYSTFTSLTTLGVDNLNPDTPHLKKIVMLEIFSSLNFLIGAVSFVISRLANF